MLPQELASIPFKTAILSEVGGRASNQDFCGWLNVGEYSCWALADGVGGRSGGEVAAKAAVEAVVESFRRTPECSREAIQSYFDSAQQTLQREQQLKPEYASMRTTLVLLIADSKRACWGHIGDSRLYRIQPCGVLACTEDHSVPQALVSAGEISNEAIRCHKDRNRLLRSLGEPGPARPTVLERALELRKDDVFLLCSDGFWEHVLESEMLADLAASATPDQWLKRSESRLFKRVAGGHDNYSALGVFYAPAGA